MFEPEKILLIKCNKTDQFSATFEEFGGDKILGLYRNINTKYRIYFSYVEVESRDEKFDRVFKRLTARTIPGFNEALGQINRCKVKVDFGGPMYNVGDEIMWHNPNH